MGDSQFLRSVDDACEQALLEVGFKRPRRGTIVWDISPEFCGWVGLNQGRHGAMVRINPFVGVHAIEVMKLCSELEGSKYAKGAYATYAVHLGELLPTEPSFEFHEDADLAVEACRLARAVKDAGVPYMKSLSTYQVLLPLLEARMPTLGGYPERVVATLHLGGEEDAARSFVQKVLSKQDGFAKYLHAGFVSFGENYLKFSMGSERDRAREQQLIEANGGARSSGGNAISGVSPSNANRNGYLEAANKEFGK